MYKYTAVIIEFRKHEALSYVLSNFLENMSNEWKFLIFHGNLNKDYVQTIIDEDLTEYRDKIKTIHLPYDNMNVHEYSRLLTSETTVYDNIDTETFLIFQTDLNKNHFVDVLMLELIYPPYIPKRNDAFPNRKVVIL